MDELPATADSRLFLEMMDGQGVKSRAGNGAADWAEQLAKPVGCKRWERIPALEVQALADLVNARRASAQSARAVIEAEWQDGSADHSIGDEGWAYDGILLDGRHISVEGQRENAPAAAAHVVIDTPHGTRVGALHHVFRHVYEHGTTGEMVKGVYLRVSLLAHLDWPPQHPISPPAAHALGYQLANSSQREMATIMIEDVVDTFISMKANLVFPETAPDVVLCAPEYVLRCPENELIVVAAHDENAQRISVHLLRNTAVGHFKSASDDAGVREGLRWLGVYLSTHASTP
ncbi:hypothetical protein OC844_006045 [Tilletia horrida]|nr:hypothetical protein OC844_006045 [Tilletia horrida]